MVNRQHLGDARIANILFNGLFITLNMAYPLTLQCKLIFKPSRQLKDFFLCCLLLKQGTGDFSITHDYNTVGKTKNLSISLETNRTAIPCFFNSFIN
jgi:hypothetical protein